MTRTSAGSGVIFYHHQVYNDDVCFLLPTITHLTMLSQIANPAQREQQGGYRTSAMTGNTSSSAKLSREVAFQFFQFHISWKYGIPHGG